MVVASIVLYIGTVFAMIWFGWRLVQLGDNLVTIVHDTIETEVRRQDDRLEKRRQREDGQAEDMNGTVQEPPPMRAGRPVRRQ